MAGHILLAGGAEFGGRMADADRRALALAGGLDAPVRIIPAAAAPDDNHERAGNNGRRWFEQLGGTDVAVVPLVDEASANDTQVADALAGARLIYLLGGFTHYLAQTLCGSAAWDAALAAYDAGAVIAGSSAGAMVLCEDYYHPSAGGVVAGLNLVPNAIVLPHHDTFGQKWADRLRVLRPEAILLGIDERTGMIDDGPDGQWTAYGGGSVTVYAPSKISIWPPAKPFSWHKSREG